MAELDGGDGEARILSASEERDIVERLCAMRREIDGRVRPIVVESCADQRPISHFDQLIRAFRSLKAVPAREADWVRRRMREYVALKQRLVLCNLAWVSKLAHSHPASAVSAEDLFQEGVWGLLKAIDRFEADRGLRLMTYATWYIREAMQQIRARLGHQFPISAHDQTLIGQIERMKNDFLQRTGRLPMPAEVGREVGKSTRLIDKLEAVTTPVLKIDRTDGGASIPIPVEDGVDRWDHLDSMRESISRLMGVLNRREREIVTRRFGLNGSEPTSLEVLGADLGVSKERIRQIQRQAIKRMKSAAKDQFKQILA